MSTFKGFSSVELRKPQKSKFDLSHQKRSSTRMGRLTPVLITECLPGDKFRGSTEILLRLAPLLAPIYDSIQLFVHFFFVPNRLIWEEKEWEKFITGGRLGPGSTDPAVPPVPPFFDLGELLAEDPTLFEKSSLSDYLGVPILPASGDVAADYNGVGIHLLPYLAYQLCWYEYYRDRNYIPDTEMTFPYGSGEASLAESVQALTIRGRDYLKEYFTSALPFTQRGEEVLMPLAGTGSVTYLDSSIVRDADGTPPGVSLTLETGPFGDTTTLQTTGGGDARIENIDEVTLTASSVSINDFRTAYALQVWLERNAVAGSRYTESIQAHFAVTPEDSRLQRPEFLGGGRIPVKISEVVTTAFSQNEADETVPAANLQGHGVTYGNTNSFSYFCTEHGFIVGIASIMAPPSYHQGMPRMFFKRGSFLDYVWPTFAKLGEQEVYQAEVYANSLTLVPAPGEDMSLFGYQSRYCDWKYIPSSNHGDFHDTLLFWTLTRNFDGPATLGAEFVAFDQTTQDRIFAVNGTADNFWMYIHNNLSVVRALPYFGVPNTLGF